MTTTLNKHHTRWRVSEETVLGLERCRRLTGQKSWDDFFQTMIRQREEASEKSASSQLTEIISHYDSLVYVINALEVRNEELVDLLQRLNSLLSFALQEESEPKSRRSGEASKLRRFIEQRS